MEHGAHHEGCHCHSHDCGCHHSEEREHGCGCGCGHDHGCGCGHDHHHEKNELPLLLGGAGLFALGFLANLISLPGWLFFVAAYLLLGWEVLATAGKNLFKGHIFDENFLMSLATLGAFAIGEYPEAVGIMLFYRVGEYFEHRAVARSRSQILAAVDLRPETVLRLVNDTPETVPAELIQVGDRLLVRPGDRIPVDGIVASGESNIDTAPVTGEPMPVFVKAGENVISGCVNGEGQLVIRATKTLEDSVATKILRSVESAAAGKPKIDRFITRFSRYYTPFVVGVAVVTAVVPSLITGQWNYWVYTALSFLVMSCPCALVLSVPLAFFAGIGKGSQQGILFKNGRSMEALADIQSVALDKTGTVTYGVFQVETVVGEDVLSLCASCEQNSSHPIAQSIVKKALEDGLILSKPTALNEHPGFGVEGVVEGKTVLCGNRALLERFGIAPDAPKETGTRVYVALDGKYLGYLELADRVKPDAKAGIGGLKKLGLPVAMFTGDSEDSACQVAEQVGISRVFSRLLPQEKLEKLRSFRQETGKVLFVGDGINDAPVLAGADVGAAMGSGTDAAIEAADVVFMKSQVQAIPDAISLARRAKRVALQNVVFALGVKALVMILGLLGYASMWMAVFADSGVAMLCVLNSVGVLYLGKK